MSSWRQKPSFILAIAAFIIGFLVTISIRSYAPKLGGGLNSQQQSVIDYVKQLEGEISTLEADIAATRERMEQLRAQKAQETDATAALQQSIDEQSRAAGFTARSGPGVILTLDDNEKGAALAQKNSAAYNPEDYIIHDKSLLYIVRGLAGAAEAIAINEQRIVDTSNIRCVGTVIMVNATRLAPPYEIKLLGDAATLQTAIENLDEYHTLVAKDTPITLKAVEELSIPAYSGSTNISYATVAEQPEAQE